MKDLLAAAGAADVHQPGAARWLMAHLLGCRPADLILRHETPLDAGRLERWQAGLRRLSAGEPVQYVTGGTEFMGRRFATDSRALIPRPETELLVERALELFPDSGFRAADVGTGSGCIAVTLAIERPAARVLAVDASAAALELARENARRHGVAERIVWRQDDLLAGVADGTLDLAISNPPYLSAAEWLALPDHIRAHEPPPALVGGVTGDELMARLAAQAFRCLAPGGRLLLEIGAGQGARTHALLTQTGFAGVRVLPDLAGLDRMAEGRR